ncbi:hypothetical protein KOR42_05960 [Thalassoglobus neptunius]|uniref:Uncharacterized protein n=1 Tax=Thalassoglobus neptunius TaxID=1938619 RepID=A0A5C5X360_9PLAN|nr:hypothetical protein [Thalassoglobus neptunius]TWT57238.1 hypothetical protein KOR42_05960 [Thalassoglobus neptunius]
MNEALKKLTGQDFWTKFAAWLFNQGLATILLFGILYTIYSYGPAFNNIEEQQHTKQMESIANSVESVVEEFRADQERDADLLDRILLRAEVAVDDEEKPVVYTSKKNESIRAAN